MPGGARASRYETILRLASGGMATVWIGTVRGALGFRQLVAIKKPHPHLLNDPAFRAELVAEARLASMIHHANVVDVRDVEIDGDEISLVMDYIEGATLGDLLVAASQRGGRLPARVCVRVLLDALAGLHAAHELVDERGRAVGLVHRDVSPQNVLVGTDGTARVADFGVAKFSRKHMPSTDEGSLKGKLAYMAPEYLRGEPIDRRFDVFAAGVVLWEALTARRLFRGANEAETLTRVLTLVPEPMAGAAPDAAALDPILDGALAKSRDERFLNAAAMAAALEACASSAGLLGGHAEVAAALRDLVGAAIEDRRALVRAKLANEPSVASLMGAPLATAAVSAHALEAPSTLPEEAPPLVSRDDGPATALAAPATAAAATPKMAGAPPTQAAATPRMAGPAQARPGREASATNGPATTTATGAASAAPSTLPMAGAPAGKTLASSGVADAPLRAPAIVTLESRAREAPQPATPAAGPGRGVHAVSTLRSDDGVAPAPPAPTAPATAPAPALAPSGPPVAAAAAAATAPPPAPSGDRLLAAHEPSLRTFTGSVSPESAAPPRSRAWLFAVLAVVAVAAGASAVGIVVARRAAPLDGPDHSPAPSGLASSTSGADRATAAASWDTTAPNATATSVSTSTSPSPSILTPIPTPTQPAAGSSARAAHASTSPRPRAAAKPAAPAPHAPSLPATPAAPTHKPPPPNPYDSPH